MAQTAGERVRAAREAAGLSQTRLSELSGIPQSSISLIERGLTAPQPQTTQRLLHAARGNQRETIDRHRDAIVRIAADHRLSDVRVFGSVAHGRPRHDSDIDLLVHGPTATLVDLAAAAAELEELLGFSVDLVVDDDLTSATGRQIERTALPL